MTTYEITYVTESGSKYTQEIKAEDVEAAINKIEKQMNQRIDVEKIEILDGSE